MKRYILLIAAIFILFAQDAMAHGGHKKEPAPTAGTEVPLASDPMYATQEKEDDDLGSSDLFSPSDLFMQGEIESPDPIKTPDMKMEGSHNEHDNMPEVEPAELKKVETSAKGYGTAAGITFFAGLIFAGLTFLKPGE